MLECGVYSPGLLYVGNISEPGLPRYSELGIGGNPAEATFDENLSEEAI